MKDARPTTGKTLAALMNILGSLEGQTFLDLFTGTGRVAGAARQRGATVVTVELVRSRGVEIRRTLGDKDHLHLTMDVRRALLWLQKKGHRFDVIFADPPYGMNWMSTLPALLWHHEGLLKAGGVVVVEHGPDERLLLDHTNWVVADSRRYGLSHLEFLRRKESDHEPTVEGPLPGIL